MTKRKLFSKISLPLAVLLLFIIPASVSAATNQPSGNGLKISPVRDSITIQPGSSQEVTVTVKNVTSSPTTLETIVNDFKSGNESGQPDIILDKNTYATTHSLKQFAQSVGDFSLQPDEQKDIKVTLTVPKGTAGGGYYGVVRFLPVYGPTSGPNGGNSATSATSVAASVGTIVLLKVPGDINHDLRLISFGVSQADGSGMFFTNGNDLSAVARFQNFGNIQEAPFGTIIVKKGDKQVASYEFNDSDAPGFVLPDSIRRFDVQLKNLSWGKYTIEGNFGYGDKGTLLHSQKTIYIIPLWLILTAIVVIILIIIGIILGRKELKRHDRKLLANYRRSNRRTGRRK